MSSLRVPLTSVLLAALTLSACSGGGGGGSLPAGADLLKQSSTAMSSVSSVGFSIRTLGQPAIVIKSADGKLLKSGDAQGTAQVTQFGFTLEITFTLLGDTLYFKGLTGGYTKQPKSTITHYFDPSAILDPSRGISGLLAKASAPKTDKKDPVGGVDAYEVSATLPQSAASILVPNVKQALQGQVWIAVQDHRLLKVKMDLPGATKGSVIASFTDFNGNFKITAPA